MQIDWLTVAAQIVNFLVLVWLLKRFLYAPITDAMRRREERIEERLKEARTAREEAEDEAKRLRRKQDELEAEKDQILDDAREEARNLRGRLEEDVRAEMEEKRKAWRDHLAEERDAFAAALQRQAGQQVLEITRRVLADYADSDLTDRVVSTFVQRLNGLDAETRKKMTEAASQEDEAARVETGAPIDSAAKSKITRAIHEVLSTDVDVDYAEDGELVLGVRLTIGDYTVEWSAVRYLDRLHTELGELIEAGSAPAGKARQDAEDAKRESA